MQTNVPAVENANVWGLIGLKKGKRSKAGKILSDFHKNIKPLEATNEIRDEKKARRLAFRGVKRQLTLWKGPVHQNRLADQLVFPLNDKSLTVSNSAKDVEKQHLAHIAATKAEKGTIQAQLYDSIYATPPPCPEQVSHFKFADRELRKRLLEKIAMEEKERFLLARMAARNKRQNKIKSKNFHRHMKKRLSKEFEKETEQLRLTNPKAFAERVLIAETNRVRERASLRHRGGSKFARMQKLRTKYDSEARDAVSEMYEKSKELTEKLDPNESSEDEDTDLDVSSMSESEESEFDEHHSDSLEEDDTIKPLMWWNQSSNGGTASDTQKHIKSQTASSKIKTAASIISTLAAESVLDKLDDQQQDQKRVATFELDIGQTTSQHQSNITSESELVEPDTEIFCRTVEESCSTDPALLEEFSTEKAELMEAEAPKDIDTFMPGWNSWTGPGTEAEDERRRKRHVIPAPRVKRSDDAKSHVIVRRRVNNDFKQHLVKSIPFPYNTPDQFEAYLSQPICREWTTGLTHHELTRPRVTVQSGRIIRPISRSTALLRDKDVERLVKQTKTP